MGIKSHESNEIGQPGIPVALFHHRTESMGFEPTVPFGHTAFREPHLKPLGQLSESSVDLSILTKKMVQCK